MPRALPVAGRPEDVLAHIGPGADVILPLANGEPSGLLDVLERENERLSGVRVHQMHALQERPYLRGAYGDRLRHVSYFLSAVERAAYADGGCQLVPAHFSDMPRLLRRTTNCALSTRSIRTSPWCRCFRTCTCAARTWR